MATRNANNTIDFGTQFGGSPLTVFDIAGATGADSQIAPGQDMEKFVEAVQKLSNFFAIGTFSGGAFKIYLEQSAWTAADLQTEIQAIGGTMASATVSDGTL
mgnify:FL=1|tara:strand:- start:287 stop:592 length:306 start_codon:yes stop_codon:yes gene_type:complete